MKLSYLQLSLTILTALKIPATQKNSHLFFLIASFLVGFLFWKITRDTPFIEVMITQSGFHSWYIQSLLFSQNSLLSVLGFSSHIYGETLTIEGGRGVKVIYGCLAISHSFLFIGLIMGHSGKVLTKVWYICLGIVIIYYLNVLRLVGISLCTVYWPTYAEQAHYLLTRLIIYGGIVSMWALWIIKFAYTSEKK